MANKCVHKYHRMVNDKGTQKWKCIRCSHYVWKANDVIGRGAECGNRMCNNKLIITPYHLLLDGYRGRSRSNAFSDGSALTHPSNWKGWRKDIVCGHCGTPDSRIEVKAETETDKTDKGIATMYAPLASFVDSVVAHRKRSDSEQDIEDPADAAYIDGKMFYDKED